MGRSFNWQTLNEASIVGLTRDWENIIHSPDSICINEGNNPTQTIESLRKTTLLHCSFYHEFTMMFVRLTECPTSAIFDAVTLTRYVHVSFNHLFPSLSVETLEISSVTVVRRWNLKNIKNV